MVSRSGVVPISAQQDTAARSPGTSPTPPPCSRPSRAWTGATPRPCPAATATTSRH
ncbi:hypothetical protein ACFQX6_21740 [Streptosporangium lutulentum]